MAHRKIGERLAEMENYSAALKVEGLHFWGVSSCGEGRYANKHPTVADMVVSHTVMSASGAAWLLVGDWSMNGFVTTELLRSCGFCSVGRGRIRTHCCWEQHSRLSLVVWLQGRAVVIIDSPWCRKDATVCTTKLRRNSGNRRFSCTRVASPGVRFLGLREVGLFQNFLFLC